MEMYSASIVLYKNDYNEVRDLIKNLLSFHKGELRIFLIDNSPSDELKILVNDAEENIEYIHNPLNPGFGAAHNVALQKASDHNFLYHFIVNPDVSFRGDVIGPMISYMNDNEDIGMMMPQILNTDGTVQNLPKLLPSPFSVFMRKLKWPDFIYSKFINNYELRFVPRDLIYSAPILSGCFTLLRMSAVKEIGSYDDKFFMYFEDWDLSRRMHQKYKTLYFPAVSVTHGYESGANKNKKLFKIFINSAITYFNKWGWFYDKERLAVNRAALKQFK